MPRRSFPIVDPVFAEIAKAIYGDIDVRELAKAGNPDGSALHADKPVGTVAPTGSQLRDQRRVAAIGLGATGVAGVAGIHAISATVKENKARSRAAAGLAPLAVKEGKMMGRVSRTLHIKPTTAAAVLGGGALALHGVELVGDSLGARAQIKAMRDAKQPAEQPVAKAFSLKPLNPSGLHVPSLRARRPKMSPPTFGPKSKAGLFQPVSKGMLHPIRNVRDTYHNVRDTLNNVQVASVNANTAAASARDVTEKAKRLIPTRQTAVLAGLGAATALTGATYLGNRHERKLQIRRANARTASRPAPVGKSVTTEVTTDVTTDVTWTGVIAKVDTEKRQVFGWASVSRINGQDIVDLQGDIVPIDEVEKSAYQYVIESRKGGDMHKRVSKYAYNEDQPLHTADMIESFVVTPEKLEKMGLPADALPLGWWTGYYVHDDEQWAKVKSGERTGFSIHGRGTRTPVSKSTLGIDAGSTAAVASRRYLRKQMPFVAGQLRHVDGRGTNAATDVDDRSDRFQVHRVHTRWNPAQVVKMYPLEYGTKNVLVDHSVSSHQSSGRMTVHRSAPNQSVAKAVQRSRPHPARLRKGDVVEGSFVRGARDGSHGLTIPSTAVSKSLRDRVEQAAHPPATKLHPVKSSFITSMGYQPQTKRLAYELRSRPGKPYEYKAKAGEAFDAAVSESKGHHYSTEVRGKNKRADGYSLADRARLFAHPQVSKRLHPIGKGTA